MRHAAAAMRESIVGFAVSRESCVGFRRDERKKQQQRREIGIEAVGFVFHEDAHCYI